MSKERETFEAWAEREMPLTYKRAILNDVSCAQETRELNFARKGYQAATAHYHPLLAEKDEKITALRAEVLLLKNECVQRERENTALKALLEQAREGLDNIMERTNDSSFVYETASETLAAINAATGEK